MPCQFHKSLPWGYLLPEKTVIVLLSQSPTDSGKVALVILGYDAPQLIQASVAAVAYSSSPPRDLPQSMVEKLVTMQLMPSPSLQKVNVAFFCQQAGALEATKSLAPLHVKSFSPEVLTDENKVSLSLGHHPSCIPHTVKVNESRGFVIHA